MTAWFLSGVFAAWAIAEVLVGLFFLIAYARARREAEYLLFGVLCFALAITTGAIAANYTAADLDSWLRASLVANAGAVLASAVNLHFVVRYTKPHRARLAAFLAYGISGFYLVIDGLGAWWKRETLHRYVSEPFGLRLTYFAGQPQPAAVTFYAVACAELVVSMVLLFDAYRSGKREARSSIVGAGVVSLATVHDIFVLSGKIHSVYLLPHAFSIYALAVASTLVGRYRMAAGQLELTTSSLREATEELRHSHDELRQVQDELSTKRQLATVGELAAAIAHEVRNPLAVIVNAVAGLRRQTMAEDDRKMLLDIVDEEAARLNRLVTDLLRFARPVTVRRAAVLLVELAHRAQSLAREGHTVEVVIADDPDVKTVWVDPGLFRLVFDNLVENALQAMPAGGTVTIEIKRYDGNGREYVRVEIRDEGKGMEPEVLERATNPFFTTRPSGTGLGLPIVQRIIEAHGGDIEIESEPSQGTTVIILIPRGEPSDVEDIAPRSQTKRV